MKKIYIKPQITVVQLHQQAPLLVGSNRSLQLYDDPTEEISDEGEVM